MSDFNERIIEEFRANGGRVTTAGFGDSLVLLHSVGARSGQLRVTPLMAIGDEEGPWLVAASKAGAPENPAWFANLRAHPQTVVEAADGQGGTGEVAVTAIVLEGDERDAAWQRFVAQAPGFADYQVKAGDRLIPVVRLARR